MRKSSEVNPLNILDRIHSPRDLQGLNQWELAALAEEIRRLLVDQVSRTGGHLASNLGARCPPVSDTC